jgi:site-specific DNA recombinase
VQQILKRNGRSGGALVKNRYGALLKGLLRCVPCDSAMIHSITAKGPKRYRYYVCAKAMKRGWHTCPSKSVPAAEIERFVVDQIRKAASDPGVLAATVRQVRDQSQEASAALQLERQRLERELGRRSEALRELLSAPNVSARSVEVLRTRDEIRVLEQRAATVRDRILAIGRELVNERQVVEALRVFDPAWEQLTAREQARVMRLIVERIDYDGAQGTVAVTFRPNGMRSLLEDQTEDAA